MTSVNIQQMIEQVKVSHLFEMIPTELIVDNQADNINTKYNTKLNLTLLFTANFLNRFLTFTISY